MRYIPNKSFLILLMKFILLCDKFIDFSLMNTNKAVETKIALGLRYSKNLR